MPETQSANAATDLLLRARLGDASALADVFPLIYDELRHLAHRQLDKESAGHTLSTTALVHEAYVRLIDQTRVQWSGRSHFMAIAATAMRRILVDHARARCSLKRGGEVRRVQIESVDLPIDERADLLVAVDDALHKLKQLDDRRHKWLSVAFSAA